MPNADQLRTLFVQENVKLIKSLPDTLTTQIEQAVSQGLFQGTPVKALERDIKEKLGLTKQRAQLIARDQMNKYSGDLTRHNQAAAGITHYRWGTSRDERVRPEHKALDGKVFAWNAPPISAKNGGRTTRAKASTAGATRFRYSREVRPQMLGPELTFKFVNTRKKRGKLSRVSSL